ncbi:hypothetical protein RRG08_062864, partial [Elysia crispata]
SGIEGDNQRQVGVTGTSESRGIRIYSRRAKSIETRIRPKAGIDSPRHEIKDWFLTLLRVSMGVSSGHSAGC